jgi:hypothetical protein
MSSANAINGNGNGNGDIPKTSETDTPKYDISLATPGIWLINLADKFFNWLINISFG